MVIRLVGGANEIGHVGQGSCEKQEFITSSVTFAFALWESFVTVNITALMLPNCFSESVLPKHLLGELIPKK